MMTTANAPQANRALKTKDTSQADTKLSALFAARHDEQNLQSPYDIGLIIVALALMTIGIIIVTSASMPVAERILFTLLFVTVFTLWGQLLLLWWY